LSAAGGLREALAAALGSRLSGAPWRPVHGGCIAESFRVETAAGPVFVKCTAADGLGVLEAERDGLEVLAAAGALRVPAPLAAGVSGDRAFLALEWIDFGPVTREGEERLGAGLAALHRHLARRFGHTRDNLIGRTPQPNGEADDWVAFFRDRRLGFQLDLAAAKGHGGRLQDRGRELLERLDAFFDDYRPSPSLLHGDLWGGNFGVDSAGRPVVFDPAVYHGDREADLAMTRLFGGFGLAFYAAYERAWPLDAGAGTRRDLYNLYHVLNHLNLFGGGYRAQAEAMIDRLLAAAGH
jgi:fructosamine-3-kinase